MIPPITVERPCTHAYVLWLTMKDEYYVPGKPSAARVYRCTKCGKMMST